MAGIAGHKHSFSTGVRVGNWNEDIRGVDNAQRMLSSHPALEVSEHQSRYANRFAERDPSMPAAKSVDSLDGHLVMAHGTNIINRDAPTDHYLSLTQAQFKGATSQAVLASKVAGTHARTELMQRKAKMVAAGVDPWDPVAATRTAVSSAPRTVQVHGTVSTAVDPYLMGRAALAAAQFTSLGNATLGGAAALSQTAEQTSMQFARNGAFTKSFKSLNGK